MNKLDYLKLAIHNGLPKKRKWFHFAFCSINESKDQYLKDPYKFRLVKDQFKNYFLSDTLELVEIENTVVTEPLFTFNEKITIDNTWLINVSDTTETTVGTLIYNYLRLVSCFGSKIPYMTGPIDVGKIEKLIASKLCSNVSPELRKPDSIYVDEYMKFLDSRQYLRGMSNIITQAASRKSITPPEGIAEKKKELLLKYKDKLNDPVELNKYEKELLDFDDNYLKGDPSYLTSVVGKVKHTARRKMFLGVGYDRGFNADTSVSPIMNSLTEGWTMEKGQFVDSMNVSRVGSFDRGMGTVNGGVSASLLIRATDNFTVQDTDCGSKFGITRILSNDIEKLVGRTIIQGNELIKITDLSVANNYLNKKITIRSPGWCKLPGDNLCIVCAGEKLGKFKNGLAIASTEVSSILLGIFMAAMHSVALEVNKLDIKKYLT